MAARLAREDRPVTLCYPVEASAAAAGKMIVTAEAMAKTMAIATMCSSLFTGSPSRWLTTITHLRRSSAGNCDRDHVPSLLLREPPRRDRCHIRQRRGRVPETYGRSHPHYPFGYRRPTDGGGGLTAIFLGRDMLTYDELVELARICWRQADLTQAEDVARELRHMAREYQQKAAKARQRQAARH